MLNLLVLSLLVPAFAEDPEPGATDEATETETTEGETAEGTEGDEATTEGAAAEPGTPVTCDSLEGAEKTACERAEQLEVAKAELEALGSCDDIKKKKKKECQAKRGDLELRIAELQPVPRAPAAKAASRGIPMMGAESEPSDSLDLDVEDE